MPAGRRAPRLRRLAAVTLALALPLAQAAEETAVLSGRIDAPEGVLLSKYRLRFESAKGLAVETRALDRSGRFRLRGVPPGRYEVRLLTLGGRSCDVRFPAVEVGAGEASIALTLARVPVCGAALPPRRGAEAPPHGHRAWIWGGGALAAVALALALRGGGEPAVSASVP